MTGPTTAGCSGQSVGMAESTQKSWILLGSEICYTSVLQKLLSSLCQNTTGFPDVTCSRCYSETSQSKTRYFLLGSSNTRVSFIYFCVLIGKPSTQSNNHIPRRCVLPSIMPHQSNRKSQLTTGSLQIRLQHLVKDAPLASPSLQSPNSELHRWKWGIARDSIT